MQNELFIFTQDCGWRGSLVVIAKDEESARKQMEKHKTNYDPNDPVEKHEIKEGWEWTNYGDS